MGNFSILRYGLLSSNAVEACNNWLMRYREKHILQLLDGIYSLMIICFLDLSERSQAHHGPCV